MNPDTIVKFSPPSPPATFPNGTAVRLHVEPRCAAGVTASVQTVEPVAMEPRGDALLVTWRVTVRVQPVAECGHESRHGRCGRLPEHEGQHCYRRRMAVREAAP